MIKHDGLKSLNTKWYKKAVGDMEKERNENYKKKKNRKKEGGGSLNWLKKI